MKNSQLFDILSEWNFWQGPISADLLGFRRGRYLETLKSLLRMREVLILSGARRAGKSTILYQLMQCLMEEGDDATSILYVNFEDYRFVDILSTDLLEQITELYFEKINPQKKPCFFFWDEVQNVANFEKYLRTLYDQKRPIKFIISGSNSKISAGEIADVLTGRNITTSVYPFAFREYLEQRHPDFSLGGAKGIETCALHVREQKPLIKHALDQYLHQGGYPEIVQAFGRNEAYQAGRIIAQYFDDIVFKDIVKRFNLRNTQTVSSAARFCIDNISNLLSYTKMARMLEINTRPLIEYLDQFEKAFFVFQNRFFSWKLKETLATNKPKKIYAIDHFYKVHMGRQQDWGRVVENVVYLDLKGAFSDVFYWKERGEVDFVVLRGREIAAAIQVSYTDDTDNREIAALVEFAEKFKASHYLIITEDRLETEQHKGITIHYIPLWLFLIAEEKLPLG